MSEMLFKNILVVSPHTDDGELGAGGFISNQISKGSKVTFLTFSIAEDSVPDGFDKNILEIEASSSASTLGVCSKNIYIHKFPVRRLCEYRQNILDILIEHKKNNYDLILCPSSEDIHQDHSTVHNEVVRAYKNTTIFGYDLPWNNLRDDQVCFYEISEIDLENKYKALKCYESQSFRRYTSLDFLQSLAIVRGAIVGKPLVEKFEVIRLILD
ncbi:PIG-L deacetylase family protein [Photobacterium leiognathi]|uniref:PIG-L deacetylase family protein n=1 Tax=Photobacterium leiognathi TaxID=553611 RepID=UPI002980E583|nr:PIG-L family deacetylase [Photobacterium leiognathi]